MKILVTGTAGFIGFHVVNRLIKEGHVVTGIDSINDYYDVNLKYNRLAFCGIESSSIAYNKRMETKSGYSFYQMKLEDKPALNALFSKEKFDVVINLAAQAGVRYSLINTDAYVNSNIIGFVNILECCRHYNTGHLVYASSSSVYGLNDEVPFATSQHVDHPISLYAASKKSNELMAHVYSHLFQLPTTGLRFFTAYGTWGRPDMALFIFTKNIIDGKPIQLFNNGNMLRDFTYIDDIVEGINRVMLHKPMPQADWNFKTSDTSQSSAPYKIYNIGNNAPVKLMDYVAAIEETLNKKAIIEFLPIQPGDVTETYADVSDLVNDLGYKPNTSVQQGIKKFIDWYVDYYKIKI